MSLAIIRVLQSKYAEAEPLFLETLASDERMLGADHRYVAGDLNNLGELYRDWGRFEEAERHLLRAEAVWDRTAQGEHPDWVADGMRVRDLRDDLGAEVAGSVAQLRGLVELSGVPESKRLGWANRRL